MMQTGIVLAGIVVNGAIALTCSVCTWKLLQFRHTIRQWDHQLNALEQEWQQTLAQAPSTILAGPQQIKQGRRRSRQLQVSLQTYYQWTQFLLRLLQWVQSRKP
ncbi:MAG: hypothetical protein F6K30_26605 [Cyanothece sp. SIO2G6]|nr:hypothetical protein [Cyanothece sp. SIO2G6]